MNSICVRIKAMTILTSIKLFMMSTMSHISNTDGGAANRRKRTVPSPASYATQRGVG